MLLNQQWSKDLLKLMKNLNNFLYGESRNRYYIKPIVFIRHYFSHSNALYTFDMLKTLKLSSSTTISNKFFRLFIMLGIEM